MLPYVYGLERQRPDLKRNQAAAGLFSPDLGKKNGIFRFVGKRKADFLLSSSLSSQTVGCALLCLVPDDRLREATNLTATPKRILLRRFALLAGDGNEHLNQPMFIRRTQMSFVIPSASLPAVTKSRRPGSITHVVVTPTRGFRATAVHRASLGHFHNPRLPQDNTGNGLKARY